MELEFVNTPPTAVDGFNEGRAAGFIEGVQAVNGALQEMTNAVSGIPCRLLHCAPKGNGVEILLHMGADDPVDLRYVLDALDEAPTIQQGHESSLYTLRFAHPHGCYLVNAWADDMRAVGLLQ